MFTGLIEEIGEVKSLTRGTICKLTIISSKIINEVIIGDSVAINGVCLTVTSIGSGTLTFDAVPETLSRSNLGNLRTSDKVNLEASIRAGQMMGGHFVLGHVDGIGTIESINSLADSRVIRFKAPQEILKYVVEKGSIAIDGISLTVASCDNTGFAIAVIPHTLSATTLNNKRPGDQVNLESDIIGKYVEKFIAGRGGSSNVTEDLLRNAGFM